MKKILTIALFYLALFATSIAVYACGDQVPVINPAVDVITTVAADEPKMLGIIVVGDNTTIILLDKKACADGYLAARYDAKTQSVTESGCWTLSESSIIAIGWFKDDLKSFRTFTFHNFEDLEEMP